MGKVYKQSRSLSECSRSRIIASKSVSRTYSSTVHISHSRASAEKHRPVLHLLLTEIEMSDKNEEGLVLQTISIFENGALFAGVLQLAQN